MGSFRIHSVDAKHARRVHDGTVQYPEFKAKLIMHVDCRNTGIYHQRSSDLEVGGSRRHREPPNRTTKKY